MHKETYSSVFDLMSAVRRCAAASPNKHETIKDLKNMTEGNLIIRAEPGAKPADIGRVLLTAYKHSPSPYAYAIQCNGVVVDSDTWEIIAVPPQMMYKASPVQYCKQANSRADWKIYAANDGSTVTLYWYKDSWQFSSANGYSIGGYTWMTDKSFETLFGEVMAANYPDFSMDKLDKDVSYTIGFRHHDNQPLEDDPARAWFIQSYSRSGRAVTHAKQDLYGIPAQQEITIPERYGGSVANYYKHLQYLAKIAFGEFCKSARNPSSTDGPAINYGYIIRSDKFYHPAFLLESDLMAMLRTKVYTLPKSFPANGPAERISRKKYVVLRSYLKLDKDPEFLTLFPQFQAQHDKIDQVFKHLSAAVYASVFATHDAWVESAVQSGLSSEEAADITKVAKALCSILSDKLTVSKMTPTERKTYQSIITDMVVDINYLDFYAGQLWTHI
jgi:hypothetical protein